MSCYLFDKFKGVYRVKAHYNQATNDWCRDMDGNLSDSFDDYYIDCSNSIEIRHTEGNELACYIPSINRGNTVLRKLYDKHVADYKTQSMNTVIKGLKENKVITFCDITDVEVYFGFKTANIEWVTPYVKPKTSGATIPPLSKSNLPKVEYSIPKQDIEDKKAITNVQKGDIKKARKIGTLTKDFIKTLGKKQQKEYKDSRLKADQYVHSIGKWDKYLKFLKKNLQSE